jgi:hypothetical protein
MIVCETLEYTELDYAITNQAPFTYKKIPATYRAADYWVNTFGAENDSISFEIYIKDFIEAFSINYTEVDSLLSCIDVEESFFWSASETLQYFHFSHDNNKYTETYEYGTSEGFSDKRSVYIDNLFYKGIIESIPSIAQQQDIINYDKLSFVSGDIVFRNTGGVVDSFIERNLFGTNVFLYYLDDSRNLKNYSRNDLIELRSFFIEDLGRGITNTVFSVQDIRKRQESKVPVELFSDDDYPDINEKYIGNPIPLAYGPIRVSEAYPVDGDVGSGTVEFRQALILISLGTVQVEIDDVWTDKIPTSTNLSTGSFTLSEADGRQSSGAPYKCRVVGSEGIVNTYSPDIIVDLNNRILNIPFNEGTYDVTEWNEEKVQLGEIGILFNKQIDLFDAIKEIQAGSNIGFRYEINASGKRTIRIDDNNRESSRHVSNVDIDNIYAVQVKTQKDLLAGIVKVNYAKDYLLDKYLFIEDSSQEAEVKKAYRQNPFVELNTHLTTETQAEDRAELYLDRFSEVPLVVDLHLKGSEYYTIRIYDIITVEISTGIVDADSGQIISGREYYGIWTAKILSIDPRFESILNIVTVNLLEKIEPVTVVRKTTSGAIRTAGRTGTSVIKRSVAV